MTTYYLQQDPKGRLIIDVAVKTGNEIKDTIESNSWIEAKRDLGYPLTSRQERMLK